MSYKTNSYDRHENLKLILAAIGVAAIVIISIVSRFISIDLPHAKEPETTSQATTSTTQVPKITKNDGIQDPIEQIINTTESVTEVLSTEKSTETKTTKPTTTKKLTTTKSTTEKPSTTQESTTKKATTEGTTKYQPKVIEPDYYFIRRVKPQATTEPVETTTESTTVASTKASNTQKPTTTKAYTPTTTKVAPPPAPNPPTTTNAPTTTAKPIEVVNKSNGTIVSISGNKMVIRRDGAGSTFQAVLIPDVSVGSQVVIERFSDGRTVISKR